MTYPFSPLVALFVAGVILYFARRRWLRSLGLAGLVAGYLGSTTLVANLLAGGIERRAGLDAGACDRLDAVVLLSGGVVREPLDADDLQALNPETQQRLLAFVARDEPSLPLVLSGGGSRVSQAAVMRSYLRRLAPAREVAFVEDASNDTWGHAVEAARLLPPPRRIALATSAMQLPRARLAFEAQGFTVCPWPLNRVYFPPTQWWVVFPNTGAVRKTEAVMHELGGWVVYRWRKWRADA